MCSRIYLEFLRQNRGQTDTNRPVNIHLARRPAPLEGLPLHLSLIVTSLDQLPPDKRRCDKGLVYKQTSQLVSL
jgi:hypothetical protein